MAHVRALQGPRRGFASGPSGTLSDQAEDLSGPNQSFLEQVVIPNGPLFGYLVMVGELALGVVLIAAAALWLTGWTNLSTRGRATILSLIVLAGVVAIFMNVNFHLANGTMHPWLIAADPNDEGADLDSLMPIIQAIISLVSLNVLLELRRSSPTRVALPSRAPAA